MEGTLISFETSKIAKEKGFDLDCKTRYKPDGKVARRAMDYIMYDTYPKVAQSILQKWLRETKGIHANAIWACWTNKKYRSEVTVLGKQWPEDSLSDAIYETYEDALEAALIEALKTI